MTNSPVLYRSPFSLGQRVFVGDDECTKATVTGVLWKSEAPQVELTWVHNGSVNTVWVAAQIVRACDDDEASNRPIEIRAFQVERLIKFVSGRNALRSTDELMEFCADRLVNVHGENGNVDYILALRERARMLREAIDFGLLLIEKANPNSSE